MRRLLLFIPLALSAGGCPPPSQYLITDVTARSQPVADAMVAADCGSEYTDAAMRTDNAGRARLEMRHRVDVRQCRVTVAKPGYPTVTAGNVSLCTTPACPATHVELDAVATARVPERAFPLERPLEPPVTLEDDPPVEYIVPAPSREYARPPGRSMEVAR